jgi:hypothetical protein
MGLAVCADDGGMEKRHAILPQPTRLLASELFRRLGIEEA